jgi:L-ribulose-5-phosphate 4-epimerase
MATVTKPSDDAAARFRALRISVHQVNLALPKAGLVTMHSGNASGLDSETGLVLIKPSGVDYDTLTAEDLCVVDLEGQGVPAERVPDGISSGLKASVDTEHHVRLYTKDAALGGIVHTHSNFATAWAAAGLPIPCALTAMADEFGGEIPCAPYLDNEGDHIADGILRYRNRGPAILLAQHGVFTFDVTPAKALKAAVMVEDVARTLWLSRQLAPLRAIPDDEVQKWWTRYHSTYGQG